MENEKKVPIAKVRKVQRYGHSLYIALPPEFCRMHGIVKGDSLPVLANHILKVVPMKEE